MQLCSKTLARHGADEAEERDLLRRGRVLHTRTRSECGLLKLLHAPREERRILHCPKWPVQKRRKRTKTFEKKKEASDEEKNENDGKSKCMSGAAHTVQAASSDRPSRLKKDILLKNTLGVFFCLLGLHCQ